VGQLKKHRVVKRWHEPISSPKRHCRSRSATETILRAHFALSLEIHLLFDIAAVNGPMTRSDRVATLGCRQGKHIHGMKHGPEAAKRQKLCVINR
jgi:hypothetical protein